MSSTFRSQGLRSKSLRPKLFLRKVITISKLSFKGHQHRIAKGGHAGFVMERTRRIDLRKVHNEEDKKDRAEGGS